MRRLLERVIRRDEGIALVLAVVVLAILSVLAASTILYTTATQQDASSKKGLQSAYALAQAALSMATTQLTTHYYTAAGQPFDTTSTLDEMVDWAPSGSQVGPSDTSACSTTSPLTTCMSWSSELECKSGVTCTTGAPVAAVTGEEQALWHITATGAVPNPSASGLLSRTITIDVPLSQPPVAQDAPDILKSVYSGAPKTADCDMNMDQQVDFSSPVYVVGNLCLRSGGSVEAPTHLVVGGFLDNIGHGDVGTAASPLPSLAVGGACNGSKSMTPNCGSSLTPPGSYYSLASQSIYATTFSSTPTFPNPPSVDWTNIAGERGDWDCGGGRDLTSNFVLTSSVHYDCTTGSGTLSWDGTTLTIKGLVYIDGNLTSQNADIQYQGVGSIYVAGNIDLGTNTRICSVDTGLASAGQSVFSGTHDCTKGANWDTVDNFLMLNAAGTFAASNFTFEGGVYSDQNITFGSGQTAMYGPIVTPQTIIPGQQAASGFPDDFKVYSGEPGTDDPYWQLGTPRNGTF